MNHAKHGRIPASAFALVLVLVLGLAAAAGAQAPRQQPPEYKEIVAALQIDQPAARLKELERIKAAYPQSTMMAALDSNIYAARVAVCADLGAVLELQKDFIAKQGEGLRRLNGYYGAILQIVTHPNLKAFDKAAVTKAVLAYKTEGEKLAKDPAFLQSIPEAQRPFIGTFLGRFQVAEAQVRLNEGDAAKALLILDAYRTAGGEPSAEFSYTFGEAAAAQGKAKEAYAAYLDAAADNYEGAAAKAKALYGKINGREDGFAAALEAKLKELPYRVEPYKASPDWKGKTVLAELFTGSECPPCVAADLGFDGILEAYPSQTVVVLEYHLPIPRPDPIMNPATKKRQDYYGVSSTPSTFFDGEAKLGGGGGRAGAEAKFKAYGGEINARLAAVPEMKLKAGASRSGDTIRVEASADKAIASAELYVVLVQKEEPYKGSNGIVFHKMVVRDLAILDPAGAKGATFDLAASEKAADLYLTDFEKTSTRFQGFKFPERHAKIDRTKLAVVVFAQDKQTKKVYNAVVADVK